PHLFILNGLARPSHGETRTPPEVRPMFRFVAALTVLLSALVVSPALAQSRIKDIAAVEGVRTNQLVGYGLVVGLNGSGDSLRNSPFTRQSLEAMMERLGVNI